MKRALLLLLCIILAATGPVPLFVVAAVVYAVWYSSIELIVLAVVIDTYYGFGMVPYYLLGTVVMAFVVELVRPYVQLRAATT